MFLIIWGSQSLKPRETAKLPPGQSQGKGKAFSRSVYGWRKCEPWFLLPDDWSLTCSPTQNSYQSETLESTGHSPWTSSSTMAPFMILLREFHCHVSKRYCPYHQYRSFPETQIPVPNYQLSTQMGAPENQHFNSKLFNSKHHLHFLSHIFSIRSR